MKFGKLPNEELDGLDLTLPADHSKNTEIIKKYKTDVTPRVYVGCAKWGRKEWVGQIYPEGTKDKDFLANYVKNFNSIELNGTFYSAKRANVESWAETAPEGFKFCPKFSRLITHIRRLNNAEENTEYYIDTMSQFGDNLGVCFLQLPENFGPKKFDVFSSYMEKLPNDFPVTVELRHKDWFGDKTVFDETFSMLEENNKGAVITDVAGRRDCVHQRLTNGTAFIRFNGYDLHPSDYKRLDQWVERIKSWLDQGLPEVHFYAHQEDETHTPITADYFIKKLNAACGLDLARPNFIGE
ncbi:MAG: DUF72 domain-containing protein [Cyclobacteriaceae bacterium]